MGSGIEQKMKFSIKDFFSKWDQIHRKLQIWSHLLKKSLIENFIFCAVKNSPWRSKFSSFPLLVLNSPNTSCHFSNKELVFIQSLDHSSVSSEITLLYLFSWNFTCYWQKEPMKVQIFRLPTVPMEINKNILCHTTGHKSNYH